MQVERNQKLDSEYRVTKEKQRAEAKQTAGAEMQEQEEKRK